MKRSIIKNISLGIACLLGVGGVVAAASAFNVDKPFKVAQADDYIGFIFRVWDETNKEVSSKQGYIDTYTPVTSTTTSWTNENWYVVNDDVTIGGRITVSGEANLILCDGKTLTASQGIEVLTGNSLKIYGQSKDTGKIIATGYDGNACIGGNDGSDCGSINIQGGYIEAKTHSGNLSTGIGGGNGKGFESIEIYGGTVEATGSRFAPAIGSQNGSESDPGTITIYGGSVKANGGENAAAIGGGPSGFGELVTISGGSVEATGGANGSGIGIGSSGTGGTVSITGGLVTATGGSSAEGSGSIGIGCKTISISGGSVTATGIYYGAGIGSGNGASGPSVTISGGKVTATGGNSIAVGIGKSVAGGNNGTLTVTNDLPVFGGGSSESLKNRTEEEYANSRWRYMKVGIFHTHNFISYSASGNVITATCDNEDGNCPLTNHQATLSISAPSGSLIYDGTAKEATYEDTSSGAAFSGITITYTKGGVPITGSPINAGTYVATISCSEDNTKTASIEYTIAKADGTFTTTPTAKANLIYTGSAQELIYAGSTSDGTIYYRLADGEYSTDIPTGINEGTYNVYYKLIGDDNHNDGPESGPIESTILDGVAAVTTGTTTTVYGTFADAVSAWNSADVGATLTLLKDVTVDKTTTVSSSKKLDLNGYGIKMDNTNTRIFDFNGGGLTINDSNPTHAHAITLEEWRVKSISDESGITNVNSSGYGTAYITGGYITGAYITSPSVGAGAAFKFNNSNIVINGGTIIGNYINYDGCSGAAFYIANSYLTMNGGSIEYNYSQNAAAALSVESSTVEINSGSISHNRSDWSGGAAISGGTNHSTFTLKLYGGHIEENVSMHNEGNVISKYNETENTTYEIKGSPTIQNNSIQNPGTNINFSLCNKINVVGALTDGARIGVTLTGNCGGEWPSDGTGAFTKGWSTYMGNADPADYFFSNDPNYYIYLKDGEAYCDEAPAAKVQNGEVITYYENLSDAVSVWNSIDAGATLTLLKDATISTAIVVNDNNNKVLDLNGFTISGTTGTKQTIVYINGGTLTINGKDASGKMGTLCNGSGYNDGSYTRGGAIALYNGGEVTINDCNIRDNECNFAGAIFISTGTTATLNNCNVYNNVTNNIWGYRGVIYAEGVSAKVYINGGEIYNNSAGVYLFDGTENRSPYAKLNGVYIHDNINYGVAIERNNNGNPSLTIAGDTIIKNNSTSTTSGARANLRINNNNDAKIEIDSELGLGDNASIGITLPGDKTGSKAIFTNSTNTSYNDASKFFSDDPNYVVGKNTNGQLVLGTQVTVTYNTNGHGDAPDPQTFVSGSLITNPPSLSVEGYDFKGWYKEAECETAWDFDHDVVSSDTILYAKMDYDEATAHVIKLINDIGPLTYDGGSDDSLDDILAAINAYDALSEARKEIVNEVNKDILDHDVTTYRNVDKVGDLIKAIPEAKPTNDYYDAVDLAKTEYDKLTTEEVTILNTTITFEQFLNDNIAVKEVVIEIEEIGEVGDDPISQEKIQKARASYDSLSANQKRLIAPEVLETLEEKESTYNALSNKGNATLIVLYIIFGILLLVGIIYFFFLVHKKKNNDDNDSGSNNGNKGAVKLASFTGLTPFIIYASQYLGAGYIVLYVIIALTVIVWATDLAIFIYKKKHKNEKTVEETKQVETTKPEEEVKPQFENEHVQVNEDEEVITITDEKGNIFNIRYIKSFTAKLIQSPDETKKYYEELKNYVLSYKKTTSRISWHYDSINSGRNQVLKFAIRGKTLCLYYPLNVEDYNDTKYKVEAVDSKKFEEVPCLYRIKNDRRLGYAKDLIDTVMANLGLVRGEEQHEVYSNLPYEPNAPLIARGLIKEQKVQVNKPVEQLVSKKVNDEGDEIITTKDAKGNIFEIRYIKSFTAKLSQASAEVKDYYNELKNYALSYKKANSRVSWHFDSINVGRNQVIKFSIRGKTLCVYYALNANDYTDTKYKVEVVESKKFEEVPCLYRIKNDRRRDYAKDLIDTVMANVPTENGKESSEDFRIPYESTKALLAKGLIKENKVQVNKPVEDKPVEQISEDEEEVVTITDEKGNIFNIRYIKSFTAKLIQSPDETKKYYEELKNYVLSYKKTTSRMSWHYDSINSGRNQVLKFAIRGKTLCVYYPLNANDYEDSKYKVEAVESKKFEEVPCLYRIKNDRRLGYAKDLIDIVMNNLGLVKGEEQHEVYSDLPYEPNAPLIARGLIKELKVQVNKPVAPVVIKAEEVDVKMSDEEATSQIKEDSGSKKHIGKKGIVNIDVIAKSFANNEVVNIESLWEKRIIAKNIGHVKVLARGSLDKKLHIELQDYSLQAVKMILLTGGTVKRVK